MGDICFGLYDSPPPFQPVFGVRLLLGNYSCWAVFSFASVKFHREGWAAVL